MGEKISSQNKSPWSTMAPKTETPLFQRRPFSGESQVDDKDSTGSPNIQAKAPSVSFNFLNIPTHAPTQVGEIQQKESEKQEELVENESSLQMQSGDGIIPHPKSDELEGEIQKQSINGAIEEKQQQENLSLQTKLTVGKPGDKYEQEADNMASQVMAMPDSVIQSQESENASEIQASPLVNKISPLVQRQTENQEEIQTKTGLQQGSDGNLQASPSIENRLASSKGGGSALPDSIRDFMEPRFGADFSKVRVHNDSSAVQMNKDLGAQAFAHGNDIYYGAGKSPGKDDLTAHELTHTIQQTGGLQLNKQVRRQALTEEKKIEAKQLSISKSPLIDNKEQGQKPELEQNSEPLRAKQLTNYISLENKNSIRRQPLQVSEASPHIQGSFFDNPIETIKDKIAEFAQRIPGYGLLGLILGKDPVSGKPIERNATNLIRGLLSLVPNGENIFHNLEQSGALQRAFKWFNQEVTKLNLSWDTIKSLFGKALQSLGMGDALNPNGAFEKIKNVFIQPIGRIKNFAIAAGTKVMEFAFEGFLDMAGGASSKVMEILRKAGGAFTNILKDPIGFCSNLVSAVRGGFQKFSGNIATHMKNGLTGWLFGALTGAGLILPDKFDLKGIVSIALQVLGVTYEKLRGKLANKIGDQKVARLEKAFDFLKTIITGGLAAAWEKISEFVGNIQEMVIGGIKEWVMSSVITGAITKLISMFNPAGAIIQAAMAIYNSIMFFIERGSQIATLAEAVFNSIGNIAGGNVAGAADYVEQTMGRSLPVMISFLTRLIGLGGISEHIKNVIKKIQTPVENAMNKLAKFILEKSKGLLGKENKDREVKKPNKTDNTESLEIPFSMNGDSHTLTLTSGSTAKVLMASNNPGRLSGKIITAINKLKSNGIQPQAQERIEALENIQNMATKVEEILHDSKSSVDDKKREGIKLITAISEYAKKYQATDIEEALKLYPSPVVGLYNELRNDKNPPPDGTTREAHHAPPLELAQTLSLELFNTSKYFLDNNDNPFEKAAKNINNAGENLPAILVHASTHRVKGAGSRIHGSEIKEELMKRLEKDEISKDEAILTSKNQLSVKAGQKAYKRYIDKKVKLILQNGDIDAIKLAFRKAYNGAAAQTLHQVDIALEQSKFDGSDEDKKIAVKNLRAKTEEVWKNQLLKPLD
jgi:Domain of unknown function (DUF4157)